MAAGRRKRLDGSIFLGVSRASCQVNLCACQLGRQKRKRAHEACHTLGVGNLAGIENAGWTALAHGQDAGAFAAKDPGVIARAKHTHALARHAVDVRNRVTHALMQAKHEVKPLDAGDDAVALKGMLAHLAQVARMAERSHCKIGKQLAHPGCEQVEVVAEDHVGLEGAHGRAQAAFERRAELRHHLGRHIAVARGAIGHDVAHAHNGKRQLIALKPHRVHSHTLGQHGHVVGPDAAHNGLLAAQTGASRHHLREVDAASGGIGLLGTHVQNAHGVSLLMAKLPQACDLLGIAGQRVMGRLKEEGQAA